METQTWFQRRKHPRYGVNVDATLLVKDYNDEREVACNIKNLSRYGICLSCPHPIGSSTGTLKVRARLFKDKLMTTGFRVVRSEMRRAENILGGELLFGSDNNRRQINLFLRHREKTEGEDRRRNDRRREATPVSVERRRSDRRVDYGVLSEAVLFQRRAPVWQSQYTFFRRTEAVEAGRIRINGTDLINFGSRDYLGLAHHPEVKKAAIDVIDSSGVDSGSRAFTGTLAVHEALERELAEFKGYESAVVFSGGYIGNVAILTGLLRPGDVAFFDEKAHASAIDGCVFSGAKAVPFKHNSLADLEKKVKAASCNRRLLVVNGVYSVQGDLAPLPAILEFANANRLTVLLDDAHGFGILGETGAGTAEHFGIKGAFDLDMGTMAGALGGFGGFVVSRKDVVEYLKHFSRPFLFTTGLPPFAAAAMLRSLRILRKDNSLRSKLWSNVRHLRNGLTDCGISFLPTESAIIAIPVGNEQSTYALVRALQARGVYVNAFVRPAVRRDAATIRLAVTASHSDADIAKTVSVFAEVHSLFKGTLGEQTS